MQTVNRDYDSNSQANVLFTRPHYCLNKCIPEVSVTLPQTLRMEVTIVETSFSSASTASTAWVSQEIIYMKQLSTTPSMSPRPAASASPGTLRLQPRLNSIRTHTLNRAPHDSIGTLKIEKHCSHPWMCIKITTEDLKKHRHVDITPSNSLQGV